MENLFSYVENFQLTEENLILLMVMFATVLIVVVIFLIVFGSKSLVRNRLQTYQTEAGSEITRKNRKIDNALESLSPIFSSGSSKEKESIRHQLMHAGFHNETALTFFYILKVLSTLFGLFGALLYYTLALFPKSGN